MDWTDASTPKFSSGSYFQPRQNKVMGFPLQHGRRGPISIIPYYEPMTPRQNRQSGKERRCALKIKVPGRPLQNIPSGKKLANSANKTTSPANCLKCSKIKRRVKALRNLQNRFVLLHRRTQVTTGRYQGILCGGRAPTR